MPQTKTAATLVGLLVALGLVLADGLSRALLDGTLELPPQWAWASSTLVAAVAVITAYLRATRPSTPDS